MMNEGLSAGDILALTRDQDGMGNAWNNPFIYLVWLALLGGNGGLFGRRDDNTLQSSLTRSDLFEGFNNQDINSQLRGITNGLCDGFYAVNNGLKDGFYGNQGTMKDGFYGIQGALAENRFAQQNCCCEIKSSIKDLSAEGYRNTCEITTAIHAEGEATRALINSNTMQELRDKLAEKDREVQARDFQLSQIAQTNNIVGQIRPCPVPAYVTCNPWGSNYNYNNGCGCGI
jgi:hypothetical protein